MTKIDNRTISTYEQIFHVKQGTLFDINRLLGLKNCRANSDNIIQIISTLDKRYGYIGQYNTHHIREFLKICNKNPTTDVEAVQKAIIMNRLHVTPDELLQIGYQAENEEAAMDLFYVDESRYKQLINPKYLQQTLQEAQDEIDYQNQHKEPIRNETFDELFDSSALEQPNDGKQPLLEEQQLLEEQVQPINNTANQIFPNDKMNQRPANRSRAKIGMHELANIVLNLQRDFKRVSNALSVQGARDIVNRHNEKSPHAPWNVTTDDINGDNIPDIIIRNANNDPIVVNGWTTKGSDYPERFVYYNKYPTREERKQHPYPAFKRDELYQIQYDDNNVDVHKRGNVIGFNQQAFPATWNLDKYNVNKNPGKRASAYRRFQTLIVAPVLNIVIPELINRGDIVLNEQDKWQDRLKHTAVVSAKLWEKYIINEVARRGNVSVDSKEFRKFKNSANGKQFIDNMVTEFYYHLHHVNGQNWTEQRRDDLQQKVLHFAADELIKSIQHTAELSDDQHHYPVYHEDNVTEFDKDVEGEFGEGW